MAISVEIRDQRLPLKMRLGGLRANPPFRTRRPSFRLSTRVWMFPLMASMLPFQRIRRSAMHRQR
jgi:hypothetical protein